MNTFIYWLKKRVMLKNAFKESLHDIKLILFLLRML